MSDPPDQRGECAGLQTGNSAVWTGEPGAAPVCVCVCVWAQHWVSCWQRVSNKPGGRGLLMLWDHLATCGMGSAGLVRDLVLSSGIVIREPGLQSQICCCDL